MYLHLNTNKIQCQQEADYFKNHGFHYLMKRLRLLQPSQRVIVLKRLRNIMMRLSFLFGVSITFLSMGVLLMTCSDCIGSIAVKCGLNPKIWKVSFWIFGLVVCGILLSQNLRLLKKNRRE